MSMAYMKKLTETVYDVIVVGGGPAGMLAAASAALTLKRVLLIEKNEFCGKKLRITGKGRCNVCPDVTVPEVLENIPVGGKFLMSALNRFPPESVQSFFTGNGVPLKTERGRRVFPVSDRAADVAECLVRVMGERGVRTLRAQVNELIIRDGTIKGVLVDGMELHAPAVIVATGGLSYPLTGSTGDGYAFARAAGHRVSECSGSLVPVEIVGGECRKMAGLNLRNVGLKLYGKKKKPVYQDFGEALFMSYGMSGPVILSASAHMNEKDGPYVIELDLKPALDEGKLDVRILRDFSERSNDNIYDGLRALLPRQMIPVILDRCRIPSSLPVHSVTKEARRKILDEMKHFRLTVHQKRPVEEAIVTRGGVKLSEVDPASMESKLVRGLFFAGEILDCDAYTGGYNLQIAWSTGYAAGISCGNRARDMV